MPPSQDIPSLVREQNGFPEFNPLQRKFLESKPWDWSWVVAAPTASGKTVLAELMALETMVGKGKKVLYTCPLRALASEHFQEFKRKYAGKCSLRMALSTGDFDSSSRYLSRFDLIFVTNEKLDSLLRHRADWLNSVGLLVVDEVHELDSDRGPTLEMVVTKMRALLPSLQVLALSATIPNAQELAAWLKAELLVSDFRSVELEEGIFFQHAVRFNSGRIDSFEEGEDGMESVLLDTLGRKKQCLVFVNNRRGAEGTASKFSSKTQRACSRSDLLALEKLSEKILRVLELPTHQCRKLADLAKKGIAFHHAGLLAKQRSLLEHHFRAGHLKVLCATPTLAAGVNTPAFRVLIPSVFRFAGSGMERIPVREYKQLAGRAGRPKYDDRGQSVLFARSEEELEFFLDHYVNGTVENVNSRLAVEPVLRTHTLALISSGFVSDGASLAHFFSKTFYFHLTRSRDSSLVLDQLEGIVEELKGIGFVEEKGGKWFPTKIGKRVSDLYLEPLSAKRLLDSLGNKMSPFGCLFALASMADFGSLVSVPKKREAEVFEELLKTSGLPIDVEREQFLDPFLAERFFSAQLLGAWVSEKSEEEVLEEFSAQPGFLHAKVKVCDWLCYAAVELARLTGALEQVVVFGKLRLRLQHGVREELLPLVEVRGIGRVRGRKLFEAGIRSVSDLKKAPVSDLARLLGKETAFKVKKGLGQGAKDGLGGLPGPSLQSRL